MKRSWIFGITLLVLVVLGSRTVYQKFQKPVPEQRFIYYIVNPQKQNIAFYYLDDQGAPLKSLLGLKKYVERQGKQLTFAMNAGMFTPQFTPVGLFIQEGKTLAPLDTASGPGNFYLKPNGVFYIKTDDQAGILPTADFQKLNSKQVKYATQSGPMLVLNGKINLAFKPGSANVNIRNGVGILPDNRAVFVLSKEKVNFYNFALYFKHLGCNQALYLDGFVSRMYLPSQNWQQLDGEFGVIIGITE